MPNLGICLDNATFVSRWRIVSLEKSLLPLWPPFMTRFQMVEEDDNAVIIERKTNFSW
jgi:hypothetical protein